MNEIAILNKVIPDELLNELIQLGASISQQQWRIGDITNEIIVYCTANKIDIPVMGIYSGVGKLTGKSVSSVRMYSDMSGFFSPEIRDQYGFLPFSHFFLAKTYGTKWKEVLEISKEELGKDDCPVSENRLSYIMSMREGRNLPPQPAQPVFANKNNFSGSIDVIDGGSLEIEEKDPFTDEPEVLDENYLEETIKKINELLNPLPTLLETVARLDKRSPIIESVAKIILEIRSLQEHVSNSDVRVYSRVEEPILVEG